ncbi:EmrB/QacA subfamily drug resistance transporter [Microbacterium halimionae]|uniref:EmrB/QacA subfamily drug resistance transporter n=1 Tax=Microbacterium halimionae TaxID=1526413 RepID=A0A7W3PMF7_9MICO|nr:MFS transporter [Microbacterium halimionae]MBA8817153.1 EmrB/QacA subfamily drug resistance transporter [Microbacterium halimionae]NII94603.1 EmrB/QacA subfamily drug resistance transporter [Microbacterium halimionae]
MAATMTSVQRRVLTIAALASFVAFLDGTVVNVALPAIRDELGGGLTTQQWVVDAYLITLGALILFAGSVSDAFGRTVVLRIGLIGFGVTSLAAGLAPDPVFLIAARAAQGAAGAFLVPSSLALITEAFDGPVRGRAIGIWTSMTTGAMIAGPLVGGALVDLVSWRLVFVINVIPIAFALWMLRLKHTSDERNTDASIDILAAVMCTLGLGLTVFALIEQPNLGWGDPAVWATFVAGIVLFTMFLLRQRTSRAPILPLDMFRARNFWSGNVATFFIYAALSLNGFVLSVYLQQGAGLPATLAGLASIPMTLLMVALSSRAGALSDRFGPRIFMTIGPLIIAVGCLLLLSVSGDFNYWTQVLPGLLLFGLGLSITVSPLTSAVLGAVDAKRSGTASAVNNAISRVAGLLAIAAIATIVGGSLDLDGFHRAAIVTAALMVLGAAVSFLGIRNQSEPSA